MKPHNIESAYHSYPDLRPSVPFSLAGIDKQVEGLAVIEDCQTGGPLSTSSLWNYFDLVEKLMENLGIDSGRFRLSRNYVDFSLAGKSLVTRFNSNSLFWFESYGKTVEWDAYRYEIGSGKLILAQPAPIYGVMAIDCLRKLVTSFPERVRPLAVSLGILE